MKKINEREIIKYGWGLPDVNLITTISRVYSFIFIFDSIGERYALKYTSINLPERQEIINRYMILAKDDYHLPVPGIIKTIGGESYILCNGYTATLTKFIAGDLYGGGEKQLYNTGRLLAKLHKAFKTVTSEPSLVKDIYPNDIDFLRSINSNDEVINQVTTHMLTSYSKVKQRFVLPRQLGHFDFNSSNLIFKDDDVVGLLDFDLIRISERARDIALAMYKLNRGDQDTARHEIFLDGYRSVNFLLTEEKAAFPELFFDETRRKIIYILKKITLEGLNIKNELLCQIRQLDEVCGYI